MAEDQDIVRRGRYDKMGDKRPVSSAPDESDVEWCSQIIAASTLKCAAAKLALAESAMGLRALLRSLRRYANLTSDESRVMSTAATALRRTLESLKVTEQTTSDVDIDDL